MNYSTDMKDVCNSLNAFTVSICPCNEKPIFTKRQLHVYASLRSVPGSHNMSVSLSLIQYSIEMWVILTVIQQLLSRTVGAQKELVNKLC